MAPLGLYNQANDQFDLYVGSTVGDRNNPDPLNTGTDVSLPSQDLTSTQLFPTTKNEPAQTPQEILADDSSTYVIDIAANNDITVYYWNPVTNIWEVQAPDGPVSKIVANTGDGDNTIIVNGAPGNTVQVDITGSGGVLTDTAANATNSGTINSSGGVVYNTSASNPSISGGTNQPTAYIGGNDVFEAAGGASTLAGSNGNDVLVGGPGNNSISGGSGNDTIIGGNGSGTDTITAANGNDVFYAGTNNENITAGDGNDTVVAGAAGSFQTPFGDAAAGGGSQFISGAGESGTLYPVTLYGATLPENEADVSYSGTAGGTTSTFDLGNSLAAGVPTDPAQLASYTGPTQPGVNVLDYSTQPGKVDVDLATGVATGPDIGTENLDNFSVIDGGPVASTLIGGSGSQSIYANDTIFGGSGGDSIVGGDGNDVIYGATPTNPEYQGNKITGGTGNDTIYGGNAHDTIDGGSGNDSIVAGLGGSSITGGNAENTIYGGAGNDTIAVGSGQNTIYGGVGNDTITAGTGANSIFGGTGNDSIVAGLGGTAANTIVGGWGDDTIQAGDGDNVIVGGDGADSITAGNGANQIWGNQPVTTWGDGTTFAPEGLRVLTVAGATGNDTIRAGNGNNTIVGGVGNDVITAGTGANSIFGGTGADSVVAGLGGAGANSILGGTGDDTIQAGNGQNTIVGGAGNDSITAGNGDNLIFGNQAVTTWGDTTFLGGTGNDTIIAGTGSNTIFGGVGDDSIVAGLGGTGANTIVGGWGNDTIEAGNGQNTIVGGDGSDSITAGNGDNIIWGNRDVTVIGANTVYGGTGNDTIDVGNGDNTIYGGTGDNQIFAGNGDNIILGGIGNDTISTGSGDNTITGGTGDNVISVAGGQNVIDAGEGDNIIQGGSGADIIRAGDGNNQVTAGSGVETIVLGDGSNIVHGGAGPDNVTFGNGNNFFYGGAGADSVVAGSGTNVIFGGQGNNFISDGAGHAIIQGGAGNNLIYGGGLSSTILGGGGNDTIHGGGGGNLIVGGTGNATITGGAGGDVIYGAEGDSEIYSGGGATKIFGDHAGLTFALSTLGALTNGVAAPSTGATNSRETITGGTGPDSLYGGAGAATITGGTGTRYIQGGGLASLIQGGPGSDVTIQAGPSGDVIIGSDGGGDSITGGAGNDRIELRGGDNYAAGGGGANVIIGSSFGNDTLVGSSGQDTLLGGASTDVLQDTSADQTDDLVANSGESGDALSADTPVAPVPSVTLPSDSVADGWWSPIAGPAGIQLGGPGSNASNPVVAAGANGPWVAWTQTNDGGVGLFVAEDVNGTWTAFGGSATGLGLGLAGASASNPSIAIYNGEPVVAWTSTTAAGSAIVVAAYTPGPGGTPGDWITLGDSYVAAGVGGIGAYDHAQIAITSAGPVVVWRDLSGATPALDALQFNGTSWVDVGASLEIPGTAGVTAAFSAAAASANVAVAFSLPTANGAALTVLQYSGGAWSALPQPNALTAAANPDAVYALSPTIAYREGTLFIAWVETDVTTNYDSALYSEYFSAGAWQPAGSASGAGLTNVDETVATPIFAVDGATLSLAWTSTLQTASGEINALRVATWNGSTFAPAQPTDVTGTGIGVVAGAPSSLSFLLSASGGYLAYDNDGGSGVFVRSAQTSASELFIADSKTSIASILASGDLEPGALILVTGPTSDSALTLGAAADGVTIAGLDGVTFGPSITINGATGVTIRNLIVSGGISVSNTANVTLAEDTTPSVTLNGATGLLMRSNTIGTLTISGASGGQIYDNTIAGMVDGLVIDAAFTGLIFNNDISASAVAVTYAAAAALSDNRIHGAAIGVATAISDSATLFGAVAGSTPNIITGNNVGVSLSNSQVINQLITANIVGVSGSGIIGGTSAALYNQITYNQTGVSGFTGLIQFNQIDDNATGINATSGLNIFSNQLVANTQNAIVVSGVSQVQIEGNTIHAYIGNGVYLTNSAKNVVITSNIIWTDTGTGIYVSDNSQTGFWSDYNTLFATGAGTIVYWTQYYADILDWQDDVNLYDLNSIGVTSVNPVWAEPHFGVDQYGFEITRPPVAGLEATDPTIDAGDPAAAFEGFSNAVQNSGVTNLLADGGFANGLTGWSWTAGGTTTTSALTPWDSTAEYESGLNPNTVLQQTVSLLQNGVTTTEIDAGAVQVAFGGQVSILTSAVSAQVSLVFLAADGTTTIGNAVVVPAGTTLGSFMRVFDTVTAPVGARSVEYLFSVAKTDSSQGALLDDAFLGLVTQGVGTDQGVRTSADVLPDLSTLGRIQLQYPQYYVNWVATTPNYITWDAYGAAAGQPVSIQLWQETANGPALLATIVSSTADTGEYAWSPSESDIAPGTTGLLIRISSVADPAVFEMSQEPFTVPVVGTEFYVATPAEGGSNRNTGTSPDSPLPNPVNLFRDYDITGGDVVNIAAGDYPLIVPLQLSGTTNYGFGLESGFTIQGSTTGVVTLQQANPDITPQALIQITGASYVTIDNLTLIGAVEGLLVNGGSNDFSAANITATGQSHAGFDITTTSPSGALANLTAEDNGEYGLVFNGSIGSITDFTESGDVYGIYANTYPYASIGLLANSSLTDNSDYGIYLQLTGASVIDGDTFTGNSTGAWIAGAGIVFGDATLTDGKGNVVSNNSYQAIVSSYATVVGNVISDNYGRVEAVDISNGGVFSYNLVFGNTYGVSINYGSGDSIVGNRIFDNANYGMVLNTTNATVSQNTLYSNAFGIQVGGGGNTIENNLIYADTYAGLYLYNAANNTIINNTIYEPTAGSVVYAPNPNDDLGAVVLDYNSTGTKLENNVIVALDGAGVFVANTSETGFVSDYNLFQTGTGGRIGTWLGLAQTTLAQWQTATGQDAQSQSGNPQFVNPTGGAASTGYVSPSQNGDADDFHLMSLQGSDHSGSLSVVVGSNGLPQMASGVYSDDTVSSPAIAAGNPATPIGAEPSPNGGIVEIGAYGGTNESSLTPNTFIDLTAPAAGATLTQGTTVSISWHAYNDPGAVTISVISSAGTTVLASGVADTGAYSWTIDSATFAPASNYVVEVASATNTATSGAFSIAAPVHIYYVNGSLSGGQYTTAGGSDSNDGKSPSTPMATLGHLLATTTLEPGDLVYVDAGTYLLTNNIVFPAADSGTGSLAAQAITIQGPTQTGLTATFNRQGTSSGFYDFEFAGASNVILDNLSITGGAVGIQIDDNKNSTGITVENSNVYGNDINIYDGVGDNGFTLTGSQIYDQLSSFGVEINTANNATIANDAITASSVGGYNVYVTAAANVTISNDSFVGGGYSPLMLYVNDSTNLLADDLTMSGSTYFGAYISGASGVFENSRIVGGDMSLQIAGLGASAQMLAEGNSISGETTGNEGSSGLIVGSYAEALNNKVFASDIGITVGGADSLAESNQAYDNVVGAQAEGVGIEVETGGTAQGNTVYGNTIGMIDDGTNTTIENNTLYGNISIGIQVGQYTNSNTHAIVNNTIVQSSGAALDLYTPNAIDTTFLDNIVSLTGAGTVALVAPAANQVGFFSDYNLYDLESGATMATWSGQAMATLDNFKTEVAMDLNSIAAVPDFVNAAADNFALQSDSPAVNRGDPALQYYLEPAGNGDRVDIGAQGGTTQANSGPTQVVQLLGQTGGLRYQVGQTTTVNFTSAGLVASNPVLQINAGGAQTVLGADSSNVWQGNEYETLSGTLGTISNPVSANGYNIPQGVLQNYQYFNNSSYSGSYAIPVAAGTYQVTLVFVDPSSTAVGQHVFNIIANGVTEQTDFDVFRAAGGANKATEVTFSVTVAGNNGLNLTLQSDVAYAMISGIQIAQVTPNPAPWTASAEVSYDGGVTWTTIATGLTFNSYGAGSFSFTPTAATGNGLLQIVATNGQQTVTDTSLGAFTVAPASTEFYISTTGSDSNSGTSPTSPMASLAALLNVYSLQPGDTINVAAGTYALATSITLGAADSGAPAIRS